MSRGEATLSRQYEGKRTTRQWIFAHLARYTFHVPFYLVAVIAWDVLSSLIPRATGRGFDAMLYNPPDTRGFVGIVAGLLAIVLVRGLCGAASTYLLNTIANCIERDMREELYLALLGKEQTFFDRRPVGDLTARAINDASQVNLMFQPGMEFVLIAVFGTLVPLGFIGMLKPELLLVPLLSVVAFAVVVRFHNRWLGAASDAMQARFGELNARLTETVVGMELVASAGQQAHERQRFAKHARAYRDAFVRQGQVQARYLPPLLLSVALVGALLHGLVLVERGQLTVGDLVAYLGLVGLLGGAIGALGAGLPLVRLGMSGAGRILEVLNDAAPTVPASAHRGKVRGEIIFEGVTFGYEGAPVVENVSFHVAPGETVALVGATGSGKSTLVKLLNRTYNPDAGRILVDGVDLRAWDLSTLRSQIAAIEQDVTLFSRSIAGNIAFGAGHTVDQGQIEQAARDAEAHEFISSFAEGYQTVVGERGASLSGGQRQRLAIARALLTDPRILVMDDATSAVDSATESAIQQAIRRLAAGRTTLLITHRLAQIKRADKVIVLHHGRLVDQGTHTELLARCTLYQRIFAAYT